MNFNQIFTSKSLPIHLTTYNATTTNVWKRYVWAPQCIPKSWYAYGNRRMSPATKDAQGWLVSIRFGSGRHTEIEIKNGHVSDILCCYIPKLNHYNCKSSSAFSTRSKKHLKWRMKQGFNKQSNLVCWMAMNIITIVATSVRFIWIFLFDACVHHWATILKLYRDWWDWGPWCCWLSKYHPP